MERLEVLGWVLEVDAAETAAYYSRHTQCRCAYCRNLIGTMEQWPSAILDAFRRMGADPRKEGEIMEFGQDPDGLHTYRLGCPVVGRVISVPPAAEPHTWKTTNYTFWISVDPHDYPVHRDFPGPIMFACLEARLPWVVGEEPQAD